MKKMRKLIPAFAMLLVSAIMMSTASFAWFTMNQEVTATGMQVQAQAAGSLVISNEPLTYKSSDIEVDFATAVEKLLPITLDAAGKWYLPDIDKTVNTQTGHLGAGAKLVEKTFANNAAAESYYFDQIVFIGSAGATQTGTLTLDLSAPVAYDSDSTLAYSIAVYVVGTNDQSDDSVAPNAQPAAIVHVDDSKETNAEYARNVAVLENVTIPTIVGVGDQNENKTGLKIVLRVFVDGDLDAINATGTALTKPVVTGREPVAVANGAEYNETETYFIKQMVPEVDEDGEPVMGEDGKQNMVWNNEYIPAVIPDDFVNGQTTISSELGWFVYKPVEEHLPYKYVNSADIPTAASSLEISFTFEATN